MDRAVFGQMWAGLEEMGRNFYHRLPYTGAALLIFLIFFILSKTVRTLTRRFTQKKTRHYKVAFIFGFLAQAALIIIGFLIAMTLAVPSFNMSQIVQLLGITSVAVGFAFRDIFQNFLAGLIILLTEPFRIGDQIKCGDIEGTVIDIQTRATMIRTYDHRRVVFPNANLFTNSITVNTAFEKRRLSTEIVIGYRDEIESVKRIITEAIAKLDRVMNEPAPDVVVTSLGEKGATLRVRWWINPPLRYDATTSQDTVLMAIRNALVTHKIDFPPNQTQTLSLETSRTDTARLLAYT